MKHSLLLFLVFLLTACGNHRHRENSIEISNHITDIILDDCVDSFFVRKIVSNYPLSQLYSIEIYDDYYFLESDDDRIIYYMHNDSIISKLDAFGRGRGEYYSIAGYAFSQSDSILYVGSSSDSKILCYKVPSFDFITSIECDLGLSAMTYYDNKIIAVCHTKDVDSPRRNGIYEINVKTGRKTLLKEVDYISATNMGTNSFSFCDKDLYIAVPGYDNIIYKYTNKGLVECNVYHYGRLNLKNDFFGVDETNSGQYAYKLIDMFEKEYSLGGSFPVLKGDNIFSFWRTYGTLQNVHYLYTKVDDRKTQSYNISIPGFAMPIIPYCVYNGWYISIIEGPIESIIDDEKRVVGIGHEIINSLRNQPFDNPVLLYFKVKDSL